MRWLLVVSQITCAAAIVLGTKFALRDLWVLVLMLPGIGLAIWAFLAMGLGKVRIMPDVTSGTQLVTKPPYRWIRHPMYTGLILLAVSLVLADPRPWRIVLLGILAITLELKARTEERLLSAHFPDYTAYRRESWKFIPWIY